MVIFAVELYDTDKARKFLRETNTRLSSKNMINNPFIGGVKSFLEKGDALGKRFAVLDMKPLWPNFAPYVAFFLTLAFMIFNAPIGAYYIPISFLILGFFWTETFFVLMFIVGIRKAGYKGKIKKVPNRVLLQKLVERL